MALRPVLFLAMALPAMALHVATPGVSGRAQLVRTRHSSPLAMADSTRRGLWGAGEPPKCV